MKEKPKSVLAWWFGPDGRRLGYRDGRHVRRGRTHKVEGPLRICHTGLHASRNILDACFFGKGDWIWCVRLSGKWRAGKDKLCATERTYLWGFKATKVLRHFARLCALKVIDHWDAPDAVKAFLNSGDEKLRDAALKAIPKGSSFDDAIECASDAMNHARPGRTMANYCSEGGLAALLPDEDEDGPGYRKEWKKLDRELDQMICAEAKRLHKIR